jgi:hypothetical protein
MPALPPADVIRLLEIRANTLQLRYRASEALLAAVPSGFAEVFLIEMQFQHALLTAETRFVQELLHKLKTGALGGVKGWQRMHELRAVGATHEEIEAGLKAEFPAMFNWTEGIEQQRE